MSYKFVIIFFLLASPCSKLGDLILQRILPVEKFYKICDYAYEVNFKITKTKNLWFYIIALIEVFIILAVLFSPFILLQWFLAKWIINLRI